MSDRDVIGSDEAGPLLGVTGDVLYRWLKGEDPPPPPHWMTPGGQYRFSRSRLIEWRDSGAGRKARAQEQSA